MRVWLENAIFISFWGILGVKLNIFAVLSPRNARIILRIKQRKIGFAVCLRTRAKFGVTRKEKLTRGQLSQIKFVLPNVVWHTDVFVQKYTAACKICRRVLPLRHGAIS